jgi:hypothetical protein
LESTLAIPAFVPATVCTGYITAWVTNLRNFRQRSLVERIFWSLPLSFAVTPIASYLIGRFISLTAVVVFLLAGAAICAATLVGEARQIRRSNGKWNTGWHPLGGKALALPIVWMAMTVLSLVDMQSDHKLFVNVALLDQSYRVNWTESVLHTGVPPANPLYMYMHPAPMRNYYFWYVVCAAIAKMTSLPARSVFTASCAWAGLGFAALIGLYLKHFLLVGARLRSQFWCSIALVTATGLDICVVLWNLLYYHISPPADLEAWSRDGIVSWLHTIFWAPHHLVSMTCCMLAFLLAWMHGKETNLRIVVTAILISLALSSAFGLSIYVAFAFFLVMIFWAFWQVAIERTWRTAFVLVLGGAASLVPVMPYLLDLSHTPSSLHAASSTGNGSLFSFAVRQMIPPDGLLASRIFQSVAAVHPSAAPNLAKLLLLLPGYALELGFFFAVFLIYLIPAWRKRIPLTDAQRSLLFIAAAAVPFMSFIRSGVLQTNDFGWRAALFVQFPMLLLGSELMMSWRVADKVQNAPTETTGLPGTTPHWLRSVASFALVIGILGTVCQLLMFRFLIPIGDRVTPLGPEPEARSLSQKAYISAIGYAELDAAIPRGAVVQYNPEDQGRDRMSMIVNMLGIDHQTAIASDAGGCGSELGGDPNGCPILAAAVDVIYNGASAEQARTICHQYGIQYLVARVYDPVWKNKSSWVWTLKPVVADADFRALECRQ